MTGDPPPPAPAAAPVPPVSPVPRRRGRPLWIVAVLGFAIGVLAMYFLLPVVSRWRTSSQPAAPVAITATQPAPAAPATPDPAALDSLAARSVALDGQLRAIEGRMANADAASRAASGYARRAEGLMIAFAARRALERGLALGYIEGQLRDRFGAEQPAAVATITAAAKDPLTLSDLREGLTRIAPKLTSGTVQDGFLTTAWREISTLVVLRREDTPSPRPNDRLERARLILDGGNVEGALAEVVRMPGATNASSWIDAAKRYIDSRRALNTLERAALSSPDPAPVVTVPPEPTPAELAPGT